jgi:hypoxanthine phosphoribosyltransferase
MIFPRGEITKKVIELGERITFDYRDEEILFISVLKGGVFFLTDLARKIDLPISIDFMAISTYGIEDSSGVVKITKDLDESIEGKHIIIVEDIIDTGLTISYLLKNLRLRSPKTIEICTLMDRESRRISDISVKYYGFKLGEKFVVGYGLDYKQKFRNLDSIYEIKLDAVMKDIESIKQNLNK